MSVASITGLAGSAFTALWGPTATYGLLRYAKDNATTALKEANTQLADTVALRSDQFFKDTDKRLGDMKSIVDTAVNTVTKHIDKAAKTAAESAASLERTAKVTGTLATVAVIGTGMGIPTGLGIRSKLIQEAQYRGDVAMAKVGATMLTRAGLGTGLFLLAWKALSMRSEKQIGRSKP